MKDKLRCKLCPKREDCPDETTPPTDEEINTAFRQLSMIEGIIDSYATRLMINKPPGLQWIFWNMLANKYRELADEFAKILPAEAVDGSVDDRISNITSINQLMNDASGDEPEWFKDVEKV